MVTTRSPGLPAMTRELHYTSDKARKGTCAAAQAPRPRGLPVPLHWGGGSWLGGMASGGTAHTREADQVPADFSGFRVRQGRTDHRSPMTCYLHVRMSARPVTVLRG